MAKQAADNGMARGIRADLRAMHREVLDCLNAVSRPRLESVGLLAVCGEARAVPRFAEFRKELVRLEESFENRIPFEPTEHRIIRRSAEGETLSAVQQFSYMLSRYG